MQRHSIRFGLAAIALVVGMQASIAQAAIASPAVIAATAAQPTDITSVNWVCGAVRCVWTPGHRGIHPWARGWGEPRRAGCFWERVRGGPWVEVCR